MNRQAIRDAALLVLLVAATRIPYFAHTLFEWDSVNYALALVRFDLGQDTPHLPGSPLHVGIAWLLDLVAGDANRAYVWEAFLLTLGSVLLVWRAARIVVSARSALLAAVVWALNPYLWFYGAVATAYGHEAFFAAATLAIGMHYLHHRDRERGRARDPLLLAATVGLAGAVRPTLAVFLLPATVYVVVRVRPVRAIEWKAVALFVAVSAAWIGVLFALAGGPASYQRMMANQVERIEIFSVLFQGTWSRHLTMVAKCLLYLVTGTAPFWATGLFLLVRHRSRAMDGLVRSVRDPRMQFLVLLVVVPLAFYLLVFFAKPGYLLGIFAVAAVGCAFLVEFLCEHARHRGARAAWAGGWGVLMIAGFLLPLPGNDRDAMHRDAMLASVTFDAAARYHSPAEQMLGGLRKVYSCSSTTGIAAADEMNEAARRALAASGTPERQTVIAFWWGIWAMQAAPAAMVYFKERTDDPASPLWSAHEYRKAIVTDSVVRIPPDRQSVVLFLWREHPLFHQIASQVRLEALPMPPYLDAWRITDSHFRIRIGDQVFVR